MWHVAKEGAFRKAASAVIPAVEWKRRKRKERTWWIHLTEDLEKR